MSDHRMAALPPCGGARHSLTRRQLLALAALSAASLPAPHAAAGQPPPLMLAASYKPGVDLSLYAVSEKYDGIRGYWDGRRLWTRGGEPVNAPAWFTAGWPSQPMDGELWAGRGRFAHAVSTARRDQPEDGAWRAMKFMVFDLPSHQGRFRERSLALEELLRNAAQARLVAVRHSAVTGAASLKALMEQIVREGGEGVMLHRLDSLYRAGRTPDLLKYKPDEDADARVIGHVAGRGRYEGMLGALLLETPEGLRFKLGTGFDDATRKSPPAVGSWVSYRYRGENDSGIPRFASYIRVRSDLP